MTSKDFSLCPIGDRLYMTWSDLENKHAPKPEIRKAKADYYHHRATCTECTPPIRLER